MREVASPKMDVRWTIPELLEIPSGLAHLDFITAQLLLQRGVTTKEEAEKFLTPSLRDLGNPRDLADLEKGAERIRSAIKKKENIIIYGDYDVDGVTSATTLIFAIQKLGGKVDVYLPERLKEGYGLNNVALQHLRDEGADLVVTVDNGTVSRDQIEFANSVGLDVVVIDHHEIHGELPAAHAIINPKRSDNKYAFKDLAAVGVTFQMVRELIGDELAYECLDLVALGTIADVVPLLGENRILAVHGLKRLNTTKRIGLRALIEVSGITDKMLDVYHVGFLLGPRINAAGRIHHAKLAFDLLNALDMKQAMKLAWELNDLNMVRQEMTTRILQEAEEQAEQYKHEKMILVGSADWSIGVAGIVAGRLMERFSKPTIVFEFQDTHCKGSARSVDGVHILEAISLVASDLEHFGGHAKAAGLSVQKEKFEAMRTKLLKKVQKTIDSEYLKPNINVSLMLEPAHVNWKVLDMVERFTPYGLGNPTPVFAVQNVKLLDMELMGMAGSHLKLTFVDDSNIRLTVVSFDRWDIMLELTKDNRYDVAFTVGPNEWNGRKYLQCKLVGVRDAK